MSKLIKKGSANKSSLKGISPKKAAPKKPKIDKEDYVYRKGKTKIEKKWPSSITGEEGTVKKDINS